MRVFLLFLVSLLSALPIKAKDIEADTVPATEQCVRYAFEITTPKAAITGIMLTKESGDEILGSMINEFGISAIDFKYNKKGDKLKLLNVISFLDKWYIKMTLKKDIRLSLHILFNIPYKSNKNYEITKYESGYTIFNKKRKLTYKFNVMPISEDDTER